MSVVQNKHLQVRRNNYPFSKALEFSRIDLFVNQWWRIVIIPSHAVGAGNLHPFKKLCTRHSQYHGCSRNCNISIVGFSNIPLIARFIGPTWSPSGADRTQVGPMLAPWTLLSGSFETLGFQYKPSIVLFAWVYYFTYYAITINSCKFT